MVVFGHRGDKKKDQSVGPRELPLDLDDLMRPYELDVARLPSHKRKLEASFTAR